MTTPAFISSGVTRRGVLAGFGIAAAASITGCSFDKGASGNASDGATKTYTVDTITVNGWGPRPTFVNNFSPASPVEGVMAGGWLYDPLMHADRLTIGKLNPWLAKEWNFDRDARTMSVTLKEGLKWSDGQPITADDVVYTVMEFPVQRAEGKTDEVDLAFTAKKVDDLTVEFTWTEEKEDFSGDRAVAAIRPYPKHVFSKQNFKTWTNNDNPVTSSPLTLETFTPQQVTWKVKTDHHMGAWDHVKHVRWVPYGSEAIALNMVLQGKLDWSTNSVQDPQPTLIDKGDNYWTVYANSSEGIFFNCAKAPFNDVAVRRAIFGALDTDKLHSLYDIGLPSISPTGLDPSVWGDQVKPDLVEPHKADVEAAKKSLADAGWTVVGGNLTKDGKAYPITYKVVAEYVNWSTWSDGIKGQLKEALGIDLKVLKIPGDQIFAQYDEGQFDIGMTWVASGTNMVQVYQSMASDKAKPIGQVSANTGRVNDPELDKVLKQLLQTNDEAQIKELGYQAQQRIVDQCYIGPFNPGASFALASGKNWTNWPPLKADPAKPAAVLTASPDTWNVMAALIPTR